MVNVLQSIDSGHEDLIHGAEIDYYGLNLATCASDNSVKVEKLANFTRFHVFFIEFRCCL
jgi:protein transport protein SEC13